jgi:PAS domain S-box-containing protein
LTPSTSEQGAQESAARRNADAREALERFFTLSLDLLCVADFHGHFARVNPAFERVLGHSSEVLLREPFMSFVHPADHAATNAAYAHVLGGADLFGFENRYRCIDGSYRWMQWATTTDREVELIYTVGRDVTAAKTSEAELRGLLAEQAALRRVATLVAREAEYAEVVAAVAEEVGKLLSAKAARVVRYESEGRGTVVGEWGRGTSPPLHTDARLELDDTTAVGRVYRSGKPAHATGFARADGSDPVRLNERECQSSYAAPIYVEGNLWGALALARVGKEPPAEGSEQRLASSGVALAFAGTAVLLVGELASIPIRNAEIDDTSAGLVGAIFGLASIVSTVGFLVLGRATLRAGVWHDWRRLTPLATGIWLTVLTLLSLAVPKVLHGGVGLYGVCLLAMATALYTYPAPSMAATARQLQLRRT